MTSKKKSPSEKSQKKRVGRPKYIFTDEEKEYILELYHVHGFDKPVAKALDIPLSTLRDRIKVNELGDEISAIKKALDRKVHSAFLRLCIGGRVEKEKAFLVKEKGGKSRIIKSTIKEEIFANLTAIKTYYTYRAIGGNFAKPDVKLLHAAFQNAEAENKANATQFEISFQEIKDDLDFVTDTEKPVNSES